MDVGAMILAAGRGERMRPLSDTTPKPLLAVGGEALIVRQLRALSRAGFATVTINISHLADQFVAALGDGAALGIAIRWSREAQPLETAGGIVNALALLPEGPALIVSADIFTDYDYAPLRALAARMSEAPSRPRAHLVMVPNPPYHPKGDFALGKPGPDGIARLHIRDGAPTLSTEANLTYGNIGVFDTGLFRGHRAGVKLPLAPLLRDWIGRGEVSGERYEGRWENVGTPADLARLDAALAVAETKDDDHASR